MKKHSKRFKAAVAKIEKGKEYSISDTFKLIKETATTKFTETVDVAVNLGVDPKHADQALRGTVMLPHGNGRTVRVLVITKTKEKEAKEAGADLVGFDEYLQKIKEGWTDVDVIVATPEAMIELGKLGKVLGPKGLMPNPKSGTVTPDVTKAVKEVKAGRVEFRVDKQGNVHVGIGKSSFDVKQLEENFKSFMTTIIRMKPATAKGTYLKSVHVSTSMGPSVKVSNTEVGGLTIH
ncbi:MAG TPA: 50S ribosomal protein L1 [bacterium]|nr:50S ribosomal protein L1 [bacterium]HNL25970.1 50S ribosomal protein L1 [bacterium]HNM15188.1 50S ribosomal protein L1 [bacterium]HNO92355.1 50S ribosomal protein L1 [bacterium]